MTRKRLALVLVNAFSCGLLLAMVMDDQVRAAGSWTLGVTWALLVGNVLCVGAHWLDWAPE